jgi:hypothetical protein
VKTSPQYYKVLLENDQVRVLEYRLKAGEKEPLHSHSRVWYMCSAARNLSLLIQTAERKKELLLQGRLKADGFDVKKFSEPTTHAVESIGDTEAHAIAVDLKPSGPH